MFRSFLKLKKQHKRLTGDLLIGDAKVNIKTLLGYSVVTPKGIIGEIEDFGIQEETGTIQFIIINTNEVFPESHLLVGVDFVEEVNYMKKYIYLTKSVDEIREFH